MALAPLDSTAWAGETLVTANTNAAILLLMEYERILCQVTYVVYQEIGQYNWGEVPEMTYRLELLQ